MSKPLRIGLPVMLHSQTEIEVFLRAKERIEKYGTTISSPLEVGAFLFFLPFAMKPENLEKQYDNQSKYKLPIIHSQSTFQSRHCLAFSAEQDPESRGTDLMDLVVNQTAALCEHSPSKQFVEVSVNVGLYIHQEALEPKSPVFFMPEEFPLVENSLYATCKERFSKLERLAHSKGMGIAIENGIDAAFANHPKLNGKAPGMFFHPFNDFASMLDISQRKLILDVAHWAGTQSIQQYFEKNQANAERKILFDIHCVRTWEEYSLRHPSLGAHLPYSRAVHICNATGPGAFLDDELIKKWGRQGASPSGIVSREQFHEVVSYARNHHLPVIIEVDYDIKHMEENQYREADPMLKYILE